MKSIRKVRTQGFSPSFIPYIRLTCGLAKSNISDDSLSPIQKTPQSAAARARPRIILTLSNFTSFHHPFCAHVEYVVSTKPEHVIITQKLMCGDVHGENIIVHKTAAMQQPMMGFVKACLFESMVMLR